MNIQGGFPLGLTGLISLLSKVLKGFLQHHNSKASILGYSAFFMVQLPHPYWKNHSFVGKVMSLLFNVLSRLVIAFLSMSKHLLISWRQSPSAVILEPRKIKVIHCFPICFPWSDGTGCHDLRFLKLSFKPTFSLSLQVFLNLTKVGETVNGDILPYTKFCCFLQLFLQEKKGDMLSPSARDGKNRDCLTVSPTKHWMCGTPKHLQVRVCN